MTKYLKHNGEEHSITGWAQKIGVHKVTLQQRLDRGWSIEQALTAPKCKPGERARPMSLDGMLKRLARQHHAQNLAYFRSLQRLALAKAKENAVIMVGTDMRNVGQPPAGTFKAPGVVCDLPKDAADRSLSSTQDLT